MNEPLPAPVQQIMDLAYKAAGEHYQFWHPQAELIYPHARSWVLSETYAALRDAVVALSQQPTLEPAPETLRYMLAGPGHPTERSASKPEAAIEDPADGRRVCACCGGSGWED